MDRVYILEGPLAPPFGGISVFISRYSRQLTKEGLHVVNLDPGRCSKLQAARIILFQRCDVLHLNSLSPKLVLLALLRPRRARLIWQSHGLLKHLGVTALEKLMLRLLLRRASEIRIVGSHLIELYAQHGVQLPREKIVIAPAFLPPFEEDAESILATYPPDIRGFIEHARPLIVANAYKLVFENGVDLYGIDLCIELVSRLRSQFPGIGLLVGLPSIGDTRYFDRLTTTISETHLEKHVAFLTEQRELWPVFRKADLMVRPTSEDGDAVSIREALYLGCPVVASDAVPRPHGTVTFVSRSVDDFVEKCTDVINGSQIV